VTRPLLTISEFARAVDLAPSALRYYHEAGLLPPTEVDPQTGYRYYTREQERRAVLLSRLRAVGVPIETMRQVLAGPADRAVPLLEAHAAALRTSAARTERVVAELVAMLRAGQCDARVTIDVDGPELAAAVRAAAGYASHETPGLAVVLLDVRDAAVHVVATDRYRLLRWQVRATGSTVQGERRAAVPVTLVSELATWLERRGDVRLTLDSSVVLTDGSELLPVEAADDRFPAYRTVLAALPNRVGRVTVHRDALLASLEQAAGQTVRLGTCPERLVVATHERELGALPAVVVGTDVTLGFAAPLLAEVLQRMTAERVVLAWSAPDEAVRVRAPEHGEPLVLVMPTRLEP